MPVSEVHAWRGIFPSLPTTPSTAMTSIDLDAQRRVMRFAIGSGVHGLICFGLAGEVFRLTSHERLSLLEVIVDEVAGRVAVFAGVGAEAEHTSMELARAASRVGADGLVVPPPFTADPSRAELTRYFRRIPTQVRLLS